MPFTTKGARTPWEYRGADGQAQQARAGACWGRGCGRLRVGNSMETASKKDAKGKRARKVSPFHWILSNLDRVVACHSWQGYKSPHGGALVDFAMDLATYQSHFQGINIQLFYASWMWARRGAQDFHPHLFPNRWSQPGFILYGVFILLHTDLAVLVCRGPELETKWSKCSTSMYFQHFVKLELCLIDSDSK